MKQHEFRERFRTEHIFKINVTEPYKLLDKVSNAGIFFIFFIMVKFKKQNELRHLFSLIKLWR